ncbi:nonsense-mediated mRNA decay factor SMG9-like [Panonychus citri]|uniref:nonsense-mediated mRNA decay factor SMG9-like n=1 Tax=Panonychus citri TaxID=50023 RepID=UPI002307F3B5|nr:nonsense-mediated mRNA decay factor SMG9-like [Panonychus citri]XP_053210962.1 nonsense-mediated mRNA decay factor SMG9-like [Panonychus citri]
MVAMKLIDIDSRSFCVHPAADCLLSETQSSGSGGFTVVSAVGMQSVGKSSLLNKIARGNIFKNHQDPGNVDSLLKHITRGVDLHVTKERLLLLDCQPLMSASILDEYIKNGSGVSNSIPDSSEPETNVFITSLQLLCFLLAVSDYVIVVNDWSMDIHLIKLIATAMMMVGNDTNQAELIFQVPKLKDESEKKSLLSSLQTFLGGECFTVKEIIDENETTTTLIKLLSRRTINDDERGANNHNCEKSWLVNAQRYWDNSIRKSTIFSDYARLML